jgi:hypothetical protein
LLELIIGFALGFSAALVPTIRTYVIARSKQAVQYARRFLTTRSPS